MFTLRDSIHVYAPIERLFALSTNLRIVERELRMKPTAGHTGGFIQFGETVRWEGWKFGFKQVHVSLIDRFEPPSYFRDRMIEGRFASFEHDHWLSASDGGTVLQDELRFSLPFGPLGWLVGRCIMVPYIRTLMRRRFTFLKQIAESDEWRQYLAEPMQRG